MTKSKTTNGKSRRKRTSTRARGTSAKSKTQSPSRLSLTDEEKQSIRDLDKQIAKKKLDLANTMMQRMDLEAKEKALYRDIRRMGEQFGDHAKTIAENHGIDPDSTTETWRLSMSTLDLERVE